MLVNGGVLDGVRLLSPKTIELMTASQTGPRALPVVGPGEGSGSVSSSSPISATSQSLGSLRHFGWIGIYGTTFWVDRRSGWSRS